MQPGGGGGGGGGGVECIITTHSPTPWYHSSSHLPSAIKIESNHPPSGITIEFNRLLSIKAHIVSTLHYPRPMAESLTQFGNKFWYCVIPILSTN